MQNRKTGQNRSHNRHDTQPNVKYHTVRASLFAIIFFGFFLVGVLEIVEKGRGRDVAYDTHQRSSNIPIAILQRSESRSRHDRGRLDGGETKSYKNIVLTTNLLLDLGQDTSGVVSCCSREPKGEKKHTRDPGRGCTPRRRP
jgi:hypothetical protein